MAQRFPHNIRIGEKLLVPAAIIAAVARTMVSGVLNSPQLHAQATGPASAHLPSFEVVSIKPNKSNDVSSRFVARPNGMTAIGTTAKRLIMLAYRVRDFQVAGGGNWIISEKYNIDAKMEDSVANEMKKLPTRQRMVRMEGMIQALLADRFKLRLHHETKDLPVYALVVAKNGPKLQEARPGDTYPNGIKSPDGHAFPVIVRRNGDNFVLTAQGLAITSGEPYTGSLVELLSSHVGRTILDRTGLKGKYDFALKWAPDQAPAAMPTGGAGGNPGTDSSPPPDTSGPSLLTALQEQLGLKLESTKGPVDILVIDHIERPSEN